MKKSDLKIFIVEDDWFFANIIENHLSDKGFDSQIFTSGEDFVNNLYQSPDIVILDHHLEKMNGLDVLRKIKAINPNIQVIFFTGQEKMSVAINALKYGAYDYLVKNESNLQRLEFILDKIVKMNQMVKENSRARHLKKGLLIGLSLSVIALTYLIFKN